MSSIVSATRYDDTNEIEYITDDFYRIVQDLRTGHWTLFRIPFPGDLLEHATVGYTHHRIPDLRVYSLGLRVTPPVLADAPRHSADVAADDEYGPELHGDH
jgi:hypothetical protein